VEVSEDEYNESESNHIFLESHFQLFPLVV
jgi:hypothetical protein